MADEEKQPSVTKNGWLRRFSGWLDPVVRGAEKVHLSAAGATLIGMGLTIGGGVVAFARNNYPELGLTHGMGEALSLSGGAMDIVDGKLAAGEDKRGRSPEKRLMGKLVDGGSDRWGALVVTMLRAETARLRGDQWGEGLALYNAVAQNLPGLLRAVAEWSGVAVAEMDVGSYSSRWLLALAGTHFPTEGGLPVQPMSEGISAILSTVTTLKRGRSVLRREGQPVTPEERTEAAYKVALYAGITGLSIVVVGGYLAATRQEVVTRVLKQAGLG